MFFNPECCQYATFTLPWLGQFEWNPLPTGLVGATRSFQKLLEVVICQLTNIVAHINNLFVNMVIHQIMSARVEDHLTWIFILPAQSGMPRIQDQSRRSSAWDVSAEGHCSHPTSTRCGWG
jgi:hypothetical protein